MKLKITKPDGTVIEAEGTVDELLPLVNPKPEIQFVPTPSLPDVFGPIRRIGEPFQPTFTPQPDYWPCPGCNGGPWWGIHPPPCTCGKRLTIGEVICTDSTEG